MNNEYSVDDHFRGKEPIVRTLYTQLLTALEQFGPIRQEPKKTSIHLAHTVGFAGVQTRKNYLLLNIRSDHPIESPRIVKAEQVSKSRFHQEVKLGTSRDIDDELLSWLKSAYQLSG